MSEEEKDEEKEYDENTVYSFDSSTNAVAVMRKLSNTLTNENRKNIVDPDNARYLANRLELIEIWDAMDLLPRSKHTIIRIPYHGSKSYTSTFRYKIGDIIGAAYEDFNPNTMQFGIEYFKNIDRLSASILFYHARIKNKGGRVHQCGQVISFKTFDSNGKACEKHFNRQMEEIFSIYELMEPFITYWNQFWFGATKETK